MDLGKCPQGFTVQHKSLVQKKKIVQRRNGATDLFHKNMKYIDNEWNDFRSHIESRENIGRVFSTSLQFLTKVSIHV